jgi:hypothetical protein
MPDTSPPTVRVIPLHPNAPATAARFPLLAPIHALRDSGLVRTLQAIRVPAELATVGREVAGKAASFLAPGVLLAVGAALLGLLAGHVLVALGADAVDPLLIGGTAGRWTLLATTGGALAARGYQLARSRWA